MGAYLNPGSESYRMAVNSAIFEDKTPMIQYLNTLINTQQRFVSVSRPRRFGKTMAADMICAYYGQGADSRELFAQRKLAEIPDTGLKWDTFLGSFDAIRVVMTRFVKKNKTVTEALEKMQRLVIRDIKKAYPNQEYFNESDLIQAIEDVYSENGKQIIIVIDEWDAVFRERPNDKEGQTEYLDFLRDLMKDNSHIALAYMTGILPIKKYGKHSALNMFTEYSMMFPRQLARFTGFTEEEVIRECNRYGRDYHAIREWYDGYNVSDIVPPDPDHEELKKTGESPKATRYALYSPLSVVEAITTGVIKDYWNQTETYEALAEYIRRDYDGLKDAVALLMDGGRLKIDTSTYQNDMTTFHSRDDVLSLLIHLGYLGYDDEQSEVFIPNREILDEFKTSTKSEEWVSTFKAFDTSMELLNATWNRQADKVAYLIEKAHDRADNKTYHDETALSYAIRRAYIAAEKYYTILPETDAGKGFADLFLIPGPAYPDKPALVIELKYNQTAEGAISQIKRREYPARLEHYAGNILLVGINYDKNASVESADFKHHTCAIETA
ncbi:MAG: AAA family ATPase [Clostridia bacterium]|nr:AAA family ATPase [Clostridia bacterium]MBQ9212236.1 AAA family ATPase [Clostridia bacterium]